MQQYFMPFLHLTLEMAPYLLLGFFVAGLLHAFVPQKFYTRYLRGSNLKSTFNAAILGVPLPLCSCGVIPTAMSLRRNGASKGATISFLTATPQTGVDSILATGSLMGWGLAVLRPVAAFITGIVGGQMVNILDKGDGKELSEDTSDNRVHGFISRMKAAFHYGYVDMMQDIGKWLVIGLVIAGLITIFVPDNFFDSLHSYPVLNMLVVLLIAMPMYVCATGSIPVAVALIMKGLSPGAAMVFLMAGPATNMAAIMVIGKVLSRKTLSIYLSTIIVCSVAFGLCIDYVLPQWFVSAAMPAGSCCHVESFSWLQIASALLLVGLLINAFAGKHHHHHDSETSNDNIMDTKKFNVEGMMCNHCKANVEKAVIALPGVEQCEVDLPSATVTVTGPAAPSDICAAIEAIGYKCLPC